MHARDRRHVTACPIELRLPTGPVPAVTEDLSLHGLFVRTARSARSGDAVDAALSLPSGETVPLRLRVAYVLDEAAASALGRAPGWGCALEGEPDERHRAHLERLDQRRAAAEADDASRVTLIEPGSALADRVSNGLSRHGFIVTRHPDAKSGYAACLAAVPDALVVSTALTGLDAWTLLQMLAGHPRVAGVPVVLVADEGGDMARLRAFRLGAMDFVEKPFTDEELALRLRRLLRGSGRAAGHAGLKGRLADVGVPMLLSLLEFERKSGVLSLTSEGAAAQLHVSEGKLLRASGQAGASSTEVVARVLAWNTGRFELVPGEVGGEDEIGQSVAQLLLEQARLVDEGEGCSADSGGGAP